MRPILKPSVQPPELAAQPGCCCTAIDLPDAELTLYPTLFCAAEADALFDVLSKDIAWQQEQATLYGRVHDLPRLTAWYGEPGIHYSYSGITVHSRPWIPVLLDIKQAIEQVSGCAFNSVLLNRYRSGRDSVAWHSDDEPELGNNPVIGSVSLGQARPLQMKHRFIPDTRHNLVLPHGSYLLMKGTTQHYWRHQVPKSKKNLGERINLTYRLIGERLDE